VLKYTLLATARTSRVMLVFRFSRHSLWRSLTSDIWRVVLRKKFPGYMEERAASSSVCHFLSGFPLYPGDGRRMFPETQVNFYRTIPCYSLNTVLSFGLCLQRYRTQFSSCQASLSLSSCYGRLYVSSSPALSHVRYLLSKCRRWCTVWNQSISIRLITITHWRGDNVSVTSHSDLTGQVQCVVQSDYISRRLQVAREVKREVASRCRKLRMTQWKKNFARSCLNNPHTPA
jgi:hypothetical protein